MHAQTYASHPLCIRRGPKPPYRRAKLFENVRTHVLDSLAYPPLHIPSSMLAQQDRVSLPPFCVSTRKLRDVTVMITSALFLIV